MTVCSQTTAHPSPPRPPPCLLLPNAAACVAAGADALVAGSFVFKGDYATNIAALKALPEAA